MGKKLLNPTTLEVQDTQQSAPQPPSESESQLVDNVMSRFRAMKAHRETSCPSSISTNEMITRRGDDDDITRHSDDTARAVGYDWTRRWQRDHALYNMQTGKNPVDPDINEVSSPLVFSSIQAIVAQFQDANTTGRYTAQAGINEVIPRIAEFWQLNWENKTKAQKEIKDPLLREALITGSAIAHNCYVKKTRRVSMMRTPEQVLVNYLQSQLDPDFFMLNRQEIETNPDKFFDEATLQQLKEAINSSPKKYLTEERDIVDFDDVYVEHVPIEEFYVDPAALNLNGVSRDARDCAWITQMPFQEVMKRYEHSDDPFLIKSNIGRKILARGSTHDVDKINPETRDEDDSTLVDVLKYYNKYTDKYIVLANNVVIRNGPLPYNHKLLPFSIYRCIPIKNSFYGVGIAAILDNIQSRDEMFIGLQDYITTINANLPGTYTDNSDGLESELAALAQDKKPIKAGQLIKIGPNDSFSRIPPIIDNGELARRRQELDEAATKISMVSPLLLNQMLTNTAVRNNQMMQENSLMGIRMVINSWASGYEDTLFQLLHILKQNPTLGYSHAQKEVSRSQNDVKARLRTIRIEGYRVDSLEDGNMKLTPDNDGQEFELSSNILDSFDQLRVHIDVETSAFASKALQAQELQDTMTMVLSIMSNPALSENKLVIELLKQYLEKKKMDSKVLGYFKDEDSSASDMLAHYQNEKMKTGEYEPHIPGMSESHCWIHAQLIIELVMEREQLMIDLSANPDPVLQDQITALTQKIRAVQMHLAGDQMNRMDTTTTAITMGGSPQPSSQTQPQPSAEDPAAGAMAQEMPLNPLPPQGG